MQILHRYCVDNLMSRAGLTRLSKELGEGEQLGMGGVFRMGAGAG